MNRRNKGYYAMHVYNSASLFERLLILLRQREDRGLNVIRRVMDAPEYELRKNITERRIRTVCKILRYSYERELQTFYPALERKHLRHDALTEYITTVFANIHTNRDIHAMYRYLMELLGLYQIAYDLDAHLSCEIHYGAA